MGAVVFCLLLLLPLFLLSEGSHILYEGPVSPGDLLVDNNQHLLINFGTINKGELYYLCGDSIKDNVNKVAPVISRTLSYEKCALSFPQGSFEGYGSGINCTGSEMLIIHCRIWLKTLSCKYYTKVDCSSERRVYDDNFYHGEPFLLDPTPSSFITTSTPSTGLIAIRLKQQNCSTIGILSIDHDIKDVTVFDTICHCLGYSHASNILKKDEFENTYGQSFSKWSGLLVSSAFIDASDINCNGRSWKCLSCCTFARIPTCSSDKNLSRKNENNKTDSLPVLQCSVFIDYEASTYSSNSCATNSSCCDIETSIVPQNSSTPSTFITEITTDRPVELFGKRTFIICAATLAYLVIMTVLIITCIWIKKHQARYQPVPHAEDVPVHHVNNGQVHDVEDVQVRHVDNGQVPDVEDVQVRHVDNGQVPDAEDIQVHHVDNERVPLVEDVPVRHVRVLQGNAAAEQPDNPN